MDPDAVDGDQVEGAVVDDDQQDGQAPQLVEEQDAAGFPGGVGLGHGANLLGENGKEPPVPAARPKTGKNSLPAL